LSQVPFTVIGVVRTSRTQSEHTPVQAALNRDEEGVIEIDDRFVDGLDGLEAFDYAWLLTWLDRKSAGEDEREVLKQTPFLLRPSQRKIGIFATRGPRRVNPVGLSLVELVKVAGTTVRFRGVDLLDGTPVIDLKPYVGRFDRPPGDPSCGWFDEVSINDGVTPANLAEQSDPPC